MLRYTVIWMFDIGEMNHPPMIYKARARAKTPAAPATPMATPPVGAGAPPVDWEEEGEAEAELEEESELESELEDEEVSAVLEEVWLAVELTPAALLASELLEALLEPVSMALLEPVSTAELALDPVAVAALLMVEEAPRTSSSKLEVAQALTLLGRELYQAG